jgi:hypothetical protein
MEQEFVRGETAEEAVSHETLGSGLSVLLFEMGKRSVIETIGNTFTSDNLLSDQGYHLSDVNNGTYTCKGSDHGDGHPWVHVCSPLEPQVAIIRGALCRLSSFMQMSPTAARTALSVPEILVSSVPS